MMDDDQALADVGADEVDVLICSNGLNPREGIITYRFVCHARHSARSSNGLNPREGIITLDAPVNYGSSVWFKWLKSSGGDYYSIAAPRFRVD